jgi:hypothetical protein
MACKNCVFVGCDYAEELTAARKVVEASSKLVKLTKMMDDQAEGYSVQPSWQVRDILEPSLNSYKETVTS